MYAIGKLAKMSNITGRTLRYFDEIGLPKSTKTRDSEHRYYNEQMLLATITEILDLTREMYKREFGDGSEGMEYQ